MARAKTTAQALPLEEGNPSLKVTIQDAMQDIQKLEDTLWEAADNLRANSKLTSSEYCMPVLGVIFLRHATNRYEAARRLIAAQQAAGTMPKRPLVNTDDMVQIRVPTSRAASGAERRHGGHEVPSAHFRTNRS